MLILKLVNLHCQRILYKLVSQNANKVGPGQPALLGEKVKFHQKQLCQFYFRLPFILGSTLKGKILLSYKIFFLSKIGPESRLKNNPPGKQRGNLQNCIPSKKWQ